MAKTPTILAIESSCDETSAAVVHQGKVLNNIIATQSIHENYGGVVPELASRAHQSNIVPVVDAALKNASITSTDLDAIAFTRGPGLLGSLLVGTSFAKAMSLSLKIPLIAVDHMEAHVLAHFIDDPKPEFPFICLTVSGGHTQIVLVKDYLDMQVVGSTRDDAVGEALTKLLNFWVSHIQEDPIGQTRQWWRSQSISISSNPNTGSGFLIQRHQNGSDVFLRMR